MHYTQRQRRFLFFFTLLPAFLLSAAPGRADEGQVFAYQDVVAQAEALSRAPYRDPRGTVADFWRNLSLKAYRGIQYRRSAAIWRDQRLFKLQFFFPAYLFSRTIQVFIVEDGHARKVPYDREMFDFGELGRMIDRLPEVDGFAGLRIHYPLNSAGLSDEVLAFLGASYFRLLGRNQDYGLSARALAVDTAAAEGEEFPYFSDFWVVTPDPDATELTVYALLNSRSITGAYKFVLKPRTRSQLAVEAVLFPRRPIDKLGIAPLTSMYWFGENHRHAVDDYRPEVHDSDGLMVHTGAGEWLWRPLINPQRLSVSAYLDEHPRGFGLIQRDQDYGHYQDLFFNYHKRPSYWVQPLSDWGKGHVELVEIPTDTETNDNISAFWVGDGEVLPGQPVRHGYTVTAFLSNSAWPPGGMVTATRIGAAFDRISGEREQGRRRFVLDYNRGSFPYLQEDQPLEAVVTASSGEIRNVDIFKNKETEGWRVIFDFLPSNEHFADLRCFVRLRSHILTETWNYLWTP